MSLFSLRYDAEKGRAGFGGCGAGACRMRTYSALTWNAFARPRKGCAAPAGRSYRSLLLPLRRAVCSPELQRVCGSSVFFPLTDLVHCASVNSARACEAFSAQDLARFLQHYGMSGWGADGVVRAVFGFFLQLMPVMESRSSAPVLFCFSTSGVCKAESSSR